MILPRNVGALDHFRFLKASGLRDSESIVDADESEATAASAVDGTLVVGVVNDGVDKQAADRGR